ncbi:MAG: STAS domain-containing protein [Gammaproteobacteria bacterium]|nr:STAS domain-containing protein [Pseudomonadales bacterium]MCP5348990.1 STAS domain-containing protein [Pseudomonadales bacterium]
MSKPETIQTAVLLNEDSSVLSLSGRLTFGNARQAYRELTRLMCDGVARIDCSGLEHADSTALALLLTALASVSEPERRPHIEGLNPRLQSLARVYGVSDLLGSPEQSPQRADPAR